MASGTWLVMFATSCPGWLSAQPQLPVLALPATVCRSWGRKDKPRPVRVQPFWTPVGLGEGSPRNSGVGREGAHAPGVIESSSIDSLWPALRSFLLRAGTGELHCLLWPAPAVLLLEIRKEFPLLPINIPVAKCIKMWRLNYMYQLKSIMQIIKRACKLIFYLCMGCILYILLKT